MTLDQYFANKTVLLTGAAGFIGSHLAQRILELGANVIGVDNFITGSQSNVDVVAKHPNFHFIDADVINPPETYLPADQQVDLVLHFASPASPPLYQAHPVETYLVNSIATHHLLQYLMKTNPNGRFVFASTSEIYGDPQVHPQPETYWGNVNPNGPRSCYDESKRLGETICGVYSRDFKLDARIVRIFNTYGPRIDLKDGRVIPQFIAAALANKPMTIYGDGSQTRSFCYVDDLVAGVLLLSAEEGLHGETLNLGNPVELTVNEAATIIDQVVNGESHQPIIEHHSLPTDDPTRRKPNISRAQEKLGWQPEVSFRDGLTRTVRSFLPQT